MKYIRTIDNVLTEETFNSLKKLKEIMSYRDFDMLLPKQPNIELVIKQADTIEELCDEFVRVSKSVHDFLVSDDIPTKKYDDTEIYGAIWTDKGLIYVAKLNKKGGLELL